MRIVFVRHGERRSKVATRSSDLMSHRGKLANRLLAPSPQAQVFGGRQGFLDGAEHHRIGALELAPRLAHPSRGAISEQARYQKQTDTTR